MHASILTHAGTQASRHARTHAYMHRVKLGIMSIVLFPANRLLNMDPISSTSGAWCRPLHTLSGNRIGFPGHFSKIVQHGDKSLKKSAHITWSVGQYEHVV